MKIRSVIEGRAQRDHERAAKLEAGDKRAPDREG